MGKIDSFSYRKPIEWFNSQDKDVKWLFGLGSVALLAAAGSILSFDTKTSEDDPRSPVVECAINMLEPDAGISEAELAISRCDTVGNLNDEQIRSLGQDALVAFNQINS